MDFSWIVGCFFMDFHHFCIRISLRFRTSRTLIFFRQFHVLRLFSCFYPPRFFMFFRYFLVSDFAWILIDFWTSSLMLFGAKTREKLSFFAIEFWDVFLDCIFPIFNENGSTNGAQNNSPLTTFCGVGLPGPPPERSRNAFGAPARFFIDFTSIWGPFWCNSHDF